jgi:DNA-binding response OmpR family regulator
VSAAPLKILVIDDEPPIRKLLRMGLSTQGYEVLEASNGKTSLELMAKKPDLVILDLGLPDIAGHELLRMIRARDESVPIVVLSSRGDEAGKVQALDLGADDYVTKPFSLQELAARVRAVLRRRHGASAAGSVYQGRHLVADFDAVTVAVDGRPIRLTRREFELLRCLVENKGRVLSRDRLLERVWGYDQPIETRSVDVHVGRLRSKLGPAGEQIETVVGLGYRFVEVAEVSPS